MINFQFFSARKTTLQRLQTKLHKRVNTLPSSANVRLRELLFPPYEAIIYLTIQVSMHGTTKDDHHTPTGPPTPKTMQRPIQDRKARQTWKRGYQRQPAASIPDSRS